MLCLASCGNPFVVASRDVDKVKHNSPSDHDHTAALMPSVSIVRVDRPQVAQWLVARMRDVCVATHTFDGVLFIFCGSGGPGERSTGGESR